MELKEFITATITAIAEATSDLQSALAKNGIIINPPTDQSGSGVFEEKSAEFTLRRVQTVSFDVAVTASTGLSGEGGGGIKVWSAEIGGKIEKSSNDERVSRVQFEIPMTFEPSDDERSNRAVKLASAERLKRELSEHLPRRSPFP